MQKLTINADNKTTIPIEKNTVKTKKRRKGKLFHLFFNDSIYIPHPKLFLYNFVLLPHKASHEFFGYAL